MALLLHEGLAVGDQVLYVAYLGLVYRGVVDFGQDAFEDRVPYAAGGGICSADEVFGTAGPGRLSAGATGGVVPAFVVHVGHVFPLDGSYVWGCAREGQVLYHG